MSWIIAGTALGGAALGAYQNSENAKVMRNQKQDELMANAAQIRYSPWTHAAVQVQGMGKTPDPTMAGVQGAMQGGLAGAMMGSQFGGPSAPGAGAAASAPPVQDAGNLQAMTAQSPAFNADMNNPTNTWGAMAKKPGFYNRPI